MKISKHISYQEATTSQTAVRFGIKNEPNEKELTAMKLVAEEVFEKVRTHFNVPIRVSSFYRNEATNKLVRGSKTSQHVKGQAIDIQGTGNLTNKEIFEYIKNNLNFDQLIWEFGTKQNPDWVHVSFVSKEKNRKQILYVS